MAFCVLCAGLGCDGAGRGPGHLDDASPGDAEILPSPDGPLPPKPEARSGFVSGTPCQAAEQCISGACTLGFCSDWAHVLRITVDTTPDGADIDETIASFPLLVRLDDGNFQFDQASPDGADLRFVDTSGNTLDYEMDSWHPEQGTASVWVLVPNIQGGSRANQLLLYYGNPFATSLSSGPSVFARFDLVLHMSNTADGVTSQSIDSSGHANTGLVQSPPSLVSVADSIAGEGIELDGSKNYLATTLRPTSPSTFSISMWFRTHTMSGGALAVFGANQAGNNGRFDRAVWMDPDGRLSFAVSRDGRPWVVRSLAGYNKDDWHFLVARFSNAGQYLMVDGESVADDPTSTSADGYAGYWRFGEAPIQSMSVSYEPGQDNYFAGALDEIRVSSETESDARVKLTYAIERLQGHVLTYESVP